MSIQSTMETRIEESEGDKREELIEKYIDLFDESPLDDDEVNKEELPDEIPIQWTSKDSGSRYKIYVSPDGEALRCSCPHHSYRLEEGENCKHMDRWEEEGDMPGGVSNET